MLFEYFATKNILGSLLALIAGMILTLSFAPFSIYPLSILAIVLLLISFLNTKGVTAFKRGFLFGLGSFGTGVYWVFISIHTFGEAPIWLATAITALFVAILSTIPGIVTYLTNRFFPYETDTKFLSAFPAIWVFFEWLRSFMFTGFPWLSLGDSQVNSPLRGFATILGVYGVSFMVVLSSGLIINAYRYFNDKKRMYYSLIILLLIWVTGSILSFIPWTKPYGEPVKISLVQGNIPQSTKWTEDELIPTLTKYQEMTQKHWDSQLVIWPETAIPVPLQNIQPFVNLMDIEAKKHGSVLITGIPIRQGVSNSYYNGVIAIGKNTNDYYLKHLLVPFGEYTPLPNIFLHVMESFHIPMSNLVSGKGKHRTMNVNGLNLATYICYEIAFANQVMFLDPKAGMLLTVTNDAWFGRSIAQPQHLAMAQMRAIETGRPVLFASNTGITAFINAKGQIQSKLPVDESGVLTDIIQPRQGLTPWQKYRIDPLLAMLLSLIIRSALIQRKLHKEARLYQYG